MMLTTKGRYAVMAMVDLAYYGSKDRIIALHEVALRQDIAINYLEQLFSKLKKHDLVNSIKGPGGGYALAKGANEITILSIVKAVGEDTKITRCLDNKQGCIVNKGGLCFTHLLWDGLEKQISSYLDSITLEDVCKGIK